MSKWESIEDVLIPKGIADLKARLKNGDKPVLLFNYEGSPIHLRIMRITDKGRVWAMRTHLYTEKELVKRGLARKEEDDKKDKPSIRHNKRRSAK